MKGKAYIPLVVGLVVGVGAIKLTFDYVRKARGNTTPGATVSVVRARAAIPMAVEITNEMVELVSVPKTLVPQGSFLKKEEVVGRVTNTMVPKEMVVTTGLLAPKGTAPGIEARIPAGYRAVAVKIDESSGVAFHVKVGSRVDVVAVMTIQRDRGQETISKTILTDIEVGAVGQDLSSHTEKGAVTSKSVTLLVKPEDVPKLHLASQRGKILLAMRNQVDMSSRAMAETTEKNLLGDGTTGGGGSAFMGLLAAAAKAIASPPEANPASAPEATPTERNIRVFTGSLKDKVTREVVPVDGRVAMASAASKGSAASGGNGSRWRTLSLEGAAKKGPVERKPTSPSAGIPVLAEDEEK